MKRLRGSDRTKFNCTAQLQDLWQNLTVRSDNGQFRLSVKLQIVRTTGEEPKEFRFMLRSSITEESCFVKLEKIRNNINKTSSPVLRLTVYVSWNSDSGFFT